jgi:hypothetical protein
MVPNRKKGDGNMSDVAKWKVHGPVEMLRSEFATWDHDRQVWQADRQFTVVSFQPNGTISSTDHHNPDGTIAHSQWFYNDAGRVVESRSWMNDGPIDRTVYVYDESGRPIRARHLDHDGTEWDVEVYSYDADGKMTKVQFLQIREADLDCIADNTCSATTGYAIEGTDSAYGAPGATTMTVTYDEKHLPTMVSFHNANHQLLSYVILMRDSAGRLLCEEFHQGERSPFQNYLDKASPEHREQLAAVLKDALGETLSSTTYAYDGKGRVVKREHRIGTLGGDCTTYRYQDHDDPVEETTEHTNRVGNIDETGKVYYSSDRVNLQQNRLEYLYDEHGNWTERIVSFRPDSQLEFQCSNIKRRTFTYYST